MTPLPVLPEPSPSRVAAPAVPASQDVLVVGEALVDIVQQNGAIAEHPGGSAANVALGIGRLGFRVDLLTHLADDRQGQAIAAHLGHSGVRVLPASFGAERTSTAVATIGADGAARYVFDVSWEFHDRPPADPARVLHIGSLAAFLTDSDRLLGFIEASGATEVTVDPNVRPVLAGEHVEALRRFEVVAHAATLIKLSDEDAEWLYPQWKPDTVLDHLLDKGAQLVALTLGARGVLLATPSHRTALPAPHVHAVDTIGAGDTVMASLIASLIRRPSAGLSLDELERLGNNAVRAASITVARAGANLPWAADLL